MTRRESREVAFIIIFEKLFQQETPIEDIIAVAAESENYKVNSFANKLLSGVFDNLEKIDEMIADNLVGWSASRISKVSRAILRLGICEVVFCDDIPDGVAINEAVEIAKKYSTTEDAAFINGVLGSVARKKTK
ncbi:MAG: transcription antitermination factor NusB [Faecalibacterium sp.]|nr:transcription antitermination factor NusB [Ruminococcus sp.]MCM1392727.1 transcription antitermination factor NusB [Ruminococcus sp.]MCM1485197.1 transcription antitermination factor NusB [Faecalibacterium sp.]